jgi:hypothetical protein
MPFLITLVSIATLFNMSHMCDQFVRIFIPSTMDLCELSIAAAVTTLVRYENNGFTPCSSHSRIDADHMCVLCQARSLYHAVPLSRWNGRGAHVWLASGWVSSCPIGARIYVVL